MTASRDPQAQQIVDQTTEMVVLAIKVRFVDRESIDEVFNLVGKVVSQAGKVF